MSLRAAQTLGKPRALVHDAIHLGRFLRSCCLFLLTGGSDDWAKGRVGVQYSFTIELPDTGRYGFLLPADRIESVGKETFEGVKAMFEELMAAPGLTG